MLDTQGAAIPNVGKNLEARVEKWHLMDCVFLRVNPKEMETATQVRWKSKMDKEHSAQSIG